ncbi:MAG: hypothetical protein U0835_12780 [Isosphaeraceae bacterium]
MKTYRVPRPFLWFQSLAKLGLTSLAAYAYIYAVTHPTPMPARVGLLLALLLFGWVFYVRLPKMPTEIDLTDDGWVRFRGRRGQMRVHVASIRSIGRGVGRRTVRLRYNGGRMLLPNRFVAFYDFLSTVKRLNPAVEIRGF